MPFFGNLFKSESRRRNKTNLMVFLRPVVVRDGAATEALSRGRYELMRIDQQGFQPVATSTLPISGSAVLPALSAETQPAPPPATTKP
jgi:general secretion pathway protein D